MSLTNKPASEEAQTKLQGDVPGGEGPSSGFYGGPDIDTFQLFGDTSFASYKFPDGSTGYAMFSDNWAFHVDNNNNMILTTGAPSQSGCGGKMIQKSESIVQRTGSVSTHVTGRKDDGVQKQSAESGNVEETKLPAYSLKVEGSVMIEAVGDEVAIKGDNITLNANSTLNLKSGKDINIQAGEKGGKLNINAGQVDIDSAFLNKNISGGEYSKGSGEVSVEQFDVGASNTLSTPGSLDYTVNGDYTLGVKGEYKTIVNKHYSLEVGLDYAQRVIRDMSIDVGGKVKHVFKGVNKASKQQETYILEIGPAKKNIPGLKVSSGTDISLETIIGPVTFKTTKGFTTFTVDEKEISGAVGKQLGLISIGEKEAKLGFGVTAALIAAAEKTELRFGKESAGAVVSASADAAEVKYGESSSVKASAADVRVIAPLIYLN